MRVSEGGGGDIGFLVALFLMSSHVLTVNQALQFMLEVTDDEDWLTNDNTEDDDDNTRWAWLV